MTIASHHFPAAAEIIAFPRPADRSEAPNRPSARPRAELHPELHPEIRAAIRAGAQAEPEAEAEAPPAAIEPAHALRGLRRPRILSQAAREGARRYVRSRDLGRLLPGFGDKRRAAEIVGKLREAEAECEDARRMGAAGYSVTRHVFLLAALVAEAAAARRVRAA